jgi:hypothetical protein
VGGNARGYTGGVLVARSIGFGALSGAALGVAGLAVLGVYPWGPEALVAFPALAVYAAVVGAVLGALVGLWCGAVLVVVGPMATADRHTVRGVASVAAGIPFVVLAALAAENGAQGWEVSGWLWWLVVAAMAAVSGAAIGSHVVGGSADPIARKHSCFRHCSLIGSVRPR